ncbi:hypothetical protein HWV62_40938, partial [Athelia sp. TMB]
IHSTGARENEVDKIMGRDKQKQNTNTSASRSKRITATKTCTQVQDQLDDDDDNAASDFRDKDFADDRKEALGGDEDDAETGSQVGDIIEGESVDEESFEEESVSTSRKKMKNSKITKAAPKAKSIGKTNMKHKSCDTPSDVEDDTPTSASTKRKKDKKAVKGSSFDSNNIQEFLMGQVPKPPTLLGKNTGVYAAGLQAGTALRTLQASESILNLKKLKLSIQTYHNLRETNPNITLSTVISSFGVGKDPSVDMDAIIALYDS